MNREWLASAKQDDLVIVRGPYGVGRSIGKIVRLTTTRFMVKEGTGEGVPENAYRRKDGEAVGDTAYSRRTLEEGTAEALKAVRDKQRTDKLVYALQHRNWYNVPLEVLEAVTLLLQKPETKEVK